MLGGVSFPLLHILFSFESEERAGLFSVPSHTALPDLKLLDHRSKGSDLRVGWEIELLADAFLRLRDTDFWWLWFIRFLGLWILLIILKSVSSCILGFFMSMSDEKFHNLFGANLLPKCTFSTIFGKLTVKHIWKLSFRLKKKFENFFE